MIISKTPFRISLIGGGTDFPYYYKKKGGLVIGGTIDKYCYVTARFLPNVFDYKHRIVWSKNEVVNNNNEIFHPTVKAVFNYLKIKKGLEVHYQGDLQKNSGLGTSSSFCVGLINSIKKLYKINTSSLDLANTAIHIEQNLMKENSGSQDQIWASYGGFNSIEFNNKSAFKVKKIPLAKSKIKTLNNNLFLIYTGIHKYSHIIEGDKMLNFKKNIIFLDQIHLLAKEFKSTIIKNDNLDFIGDLLNEYWFLKKKLSNKVSNSKIDEIYNECINAGASGGKIIGSGGGGFLLMYCKKKFHNTFKKRLQKLPIVSFKFVEEGGKIIFENKD